MREILFRAKRHKDYGEGWVYGVPFVDYAGDCIMKDNATERVVDPDTVGQYTGLTDKNGTKIFEGDVVHMNSRKFGLSGHGLVVYRNGSFAIDDRKRNRLYPFMQNGQYNAVDYRVYGNVHDNPELLEVRNG